MRLSELDEWARAHHGIITLEASGLSRSAWYRALRRGTLDGIHPFVARLVGTPETPQQRIFAAVAAIGEPTLASHRSAARLWGVPRPDDDPVDVIITGKRRSLQLDGVVIHHPTDRSGLTEVQRDGIACTDVLRTLVDLGAVDHAGVLAAVGHVLTSGLASLDAIESAVADHARQGRGGTVALRDAIADWSIDGKPADSIVEVLMKRLIDRFELPPVEFHPVIEGHQVDFRVIGTPVLLECDRWQDHGRDRDTFERDRVRDAELVAAGWLVLRFSYWSITTQPELTAERIRAAVDRWAPAGPLGWLPPDAA